MIKGKIIKGIAGFYYVHDGHDKVYECKAKGLFRSRGIKPLVGDNVAVEVLSEDERLGNIQQIFPRKNSLIRPASANVDQALVIFAVREPDPSLNLLDRFLVMMGIRQIPCRICFNKSDLTDPDPYAEIYRRAGYRVCCTCAETGEGVSEVRELLQGKTTVMAGPSGVGKSSMMNRIYPEAGVQTGGVSQKLGRGRHTTRHTELFCVGTDTYLLDTPGFSSLELDGITCEKLRFYYPEMENLEGKCRFQGCVHAKEPGCAVKSAVEEGVISRQRYDNYLLLYEELKNRKRYK